METVIFDDKLKFINVTDINVRFCRRYNNHDESTFDYIIADVYASDIESSKRVFDFETISFKSLYDLVIDYIKDNETFKKFDINIKKLPLVNYHYTGTKYHLLIDNLASVS